VYTLCHKQILRRVAGRGAPVASLRIVLSAIITLHVVGWYALLKLHCAELVFYVCKCVVRVVAPWRFDVRFGAPQRPCEGADGGGGRVRHPATPLAARAVARAVAARSVCARPPKGLCEGTFRRDKLGLFGGIGFFNKEDSTRKGGTVQVRTSERIIRGE